MNNSPCFSTVLDNELVKANFDLDQVIDCVEQTWRWHGEGKVVMPPKVTTDMTSMGVAGWFNSMPSYIQPLDCAGAKIVGGYLGNPSKGMPYIKSNIIITDPHTGQLRALICGDWISDARTGAQAAVAIKYLARSTNVIALIGAGNQARFVIRCIQQRYRVGELRVCDIKADARTRFVQEFATDSFKVVPYERIEDACKEADIIITITTANAPLIREAWCKPGCLVLTMGSYTETHDDVPLSFDSIYLDSMEQGLHRGNLKEITERGLITADNIAAELPYVVTGAESGRTKEHQRILCELVGMGSADLAVAAQVLQRIEAQKNAPLKIDMMNGQVCLPS